MTRQELMDLPVGTLLYNCEYEGEVKMDGKFKCIEILIPIKYMDDDSRDSICRPETWDVLE